MLVIVTIVMDNYLHRVRHQHYCYGPLLTTCPSSPLLLWLFTDLLVTDLLVTTVTVDLYLSVITTVAMDHH